MVRIGRNVRRNRRRRGRNTTQRTRTRNTRALRLFRRPPRISQIPRTTGLSSGGSSTTISFEKPFQVSTSTATSSGIPYAKFSTSTQVIEISPSSIFTARQDALNLLQDIYTEYRLDFLSVHWIHHLSFNSSGQIAMAVVDENFGTSDSTNFDDVRVAPNSASCHVTARSGLSWAPTEPTDQDFTNVASMRAKILVACSALQAPGIFTSNEKVTIGVLHCKARMTFRSPNPDWKRSVTRILERIRSGDMDDVLTSLGYTRRGAITSGCLASPSDQLAALGMNDE